MKKMVKRSLALLLSLIMVLSMTACGSSSGSEDASSADTSSDTEEAAETEETASETTVLDNFKIGVLVSDATSAEALAFRAYYEDYIQDAYDVTFVYSDELADAAGETSAIDNFITNNCKAVISFSSFDRAAQIEQCESAGVYYAVATGTLTDDEYETYKEYEYYVGAIGPSLEVEYQAGYDMASYYIEQGMTNFAIFGGAVPYYTDMHIYRVAGMLMAMVDASGVDYKGAATAGEVIGQIYADGSVDTGSIGDFTISGYLGGYDMDDAWFASAAEMVQTSGLEVVLAVGNGSDFFGSYAQSAGVKVASVDAYAEDYVTAMEYGLLDYLAGKFSAGIGPIFVAVYRAVAGNALRTDEGYALALSQGYWVATSADEATEYYSVDSSTESPAYTKDMLDTLLSCDYDSFTSFVESYAFEDIQEMAQ